jgi:ankyrin repeat protein
MSDLVEAMRDAVFQSDLAEVKRLLAAGADPNTKNSLGTGSMLCMAAYADQREIALALLEAGANPNLADEAPLVLALSREHYELAELLLQRGADPGHGAGSTGSALSNLLSLRPAAKAVAWLLEHGADPNVRNKFGSPVLLQAVKNGLTEVVDVLIRAGADVNAQHGLDSPLASARYYKHKKIVALLEAAGARGRQ